MCRNRVIGVYPKENDHFCEIFFFEFWPPKRFERGRKASHCILKTVRNFLVLNRGFSLLRYEVIGEVAF